MAGLFYFIEGHCGIEQWRALGLESRLAGGPTICECTAEIGPAGKVGTIFHKYAGNGLPRPLDWTPAAGGAYYVGLHRHGRPGPAELFNGTRITAGARVKLRDGDWWLVPCVRACRERDPQRGDGLPRMYGADGTERVPDEYHELVERAERVRAALLDENGPGVPEAEALALVGGVLGVCYRVGTAELLALGLLDKANVELIAAEAVDLIEWFKAALPPAAAQRADDLGLSWAAVQQLRAGLEA